MSGPAILFSREGSGQHIPGPYFFRRTAGRTSPATLSEVPEPGSGPKPPPGLREIRKPCGLQELSPLAGRRWGGSAILWVWLSVASRAVTG